MKTDDGLVLVRNKLHQHQGIEPINMIIAMIKSRQDIIIIIIATIIIDVVVVIGCDPIPINVPEYGRKGLLFQPGMLGVEGG